MLNIKISLTLWKNISAGSTESSLTGKEIQNKTELNVRIYKKWTMFVYIVYKLLYLEHLKLKQIRFTDLYYRVDFAKSTLKKLKHSIISSWSVP